MESTAGTSLRLQASLRSRGLGGIGLFVTIGPRYNDLILLSPLSEIVGRSRIDARSPERALVVYDGGWIGAVWARVQGRISLVEDVEARAQGCIVAPL